MSQSDLAARASTDLDPERGTTLSRSRADRVTVRTAERPTTPVETPERRGHAPQREANGCSNDLAVVRRFADASESLVGARFRRPGRCFPSARRSQHRALQARGDARQRMTNQAIASLRRGDYSRAFLHSGFARAIPRASRRAQIRAASYGATLLEPGGSMPCSAFMLARREPIVPSDEHPVVPSEIGTSQGNVGGFSLPASSTAPSFERAACRCASKGTPSQSGTPAPLSRAVRSRCCDGKRPPSAPWRWLARWDVHRTLDRRRQNRVQVAASVRLPACCAAYHRRLAREAT